MKCFSHCISKNKHCKLCPRVRPRVWAGRPHFPAVLVAEKLQEIRFALFSQQPAAWFILSSCGANKSTLEPVWMELPAEETRLLQSREANAWLGRCLSHSLYSENTGKSKGAFYIVCNLTFQTQSCVQIRLLGIHYLYQAFPTNIISWKLFHIIIYFQNIILMATCFIIWVFLTLFNCTEFSLL